MNTNPTLEEFHAEFSNYCSPRRRTFTQEGLRPFVACAKISDSHEKLLVKFLAWIADGRVKEDIPKLPAVFTVEESFKLLDGDTLFKSSPNEFDLDVLCFEMKLLYVPHFNEESGWFAGEIRIEGSNQDLRPSLQKNNPDVYENICVAIQEEMKERKESA